MKWAEKYMCTKNRKKGLNFFIEIYAYIFIYTCIHVLKKKQKLYYMKIIKLSMEQKYM